jgi:hypothetical protein
MAAYEELRQAVLDRRIAHAQSQALALFVRQGMLGWVTAWSQCCAVRVTSESARSLTTRAAVLADGAGTQVVRILADMVLGETRQTPRGGE